MLFFYSVHWCLIGSTSLSLSPSVPNVDSRRDSTMSSFHEWKQSQELQHGPGAQNQLFGQGGGAMKVDHAYVYQGASQLCTPLCAV